MSGANTPKDLSGNVRKKFQNGWTKEQEQLLSKWADYAACYKWLHDRTEKKLSMSNNSITIPVIILSTITGTASVGLTGLVGDIPDGQKYGQIAIGMVSLFTAILTTLGNYFRYAQNSEAHRVAAVAWGKFNRSISVELAQKPDDRMDSLDFIGICRQDLDRLIEQSPPIPDDVIKKFEKEFKDLKDLKVPDVCNGIEHTPVYNNDKSRLQVVTAELALNLKHKKRVMREEILPDLDSRMKRMIDASIKDYKDKLDEEKKQQQQQQDPYAFMTDVRKRLGDVVSSIQDIHVSELSPRPENVVIDIVGQKRHV